MTGRPCTTRGPTAPRSSSRCSRSTQPNGVGLSPDGHTLYVAETHTGRVWQWNVPEPGVIEGTNPFGPAGGDLLCGLPGFQMLDSLAVDGDGWVCVGTLVNGGITSISPDGSEVVHTPFDDLLVTNIAFRAPTRSPS